MDKCQYCPLRDRDVTCPSVSHADYCRKVSYEKNQPYGYWTRQILDEAAKLPPPPPKPLVKAKAALPGQVRVGMLCPVLTQGGAEHWQLTLARLVTGVSWRGCFVMNGTVDEGMAAAMRAYMPVWVGPDLEEARALAEDCDVLIAWAIEDLGPVLQGLSRPPKVLSVSHSPYQCSHATGLYARTEWVDRWAAVSEYARLALPEAVRDRCQIVGNCVDPDRLVSTRTRAEMHRAWGVPDGALVAGFYGRISPEKRPEVMIEIARNLPSPWHVVLVGPDWMTGLRESADLPNLHWAGADPAAGDVLRAMDVLVVPSMFESWCLVIAEAITVGTPVVSTPVGIAGLTPGLTRLVPHDASGVELARQCEASVWEGRPAGQLALIRDAVPQWEPGQFGPAWSAVLGVK